VIEPDVAGSGKLWVVYTVNDWRSNDSVAFGENRYIAAAMTTSAIDCPLSVHRASRICREGLHYVLQSRCAFVCMTDTGKLISLRKHVPTGSHGKDALDLDVRIASFGDHQDTDQSQTHSRNQKRSRSDPRHVIVNEHPLLPCKAITNNRDEFRRILTDFLPFYGKTWRARCFSYTHQPSGRLLHDIRANYR